MSPTTPPDAGTSAGGHAGGDADATTDGSRSGIRLSEATWPEVDATDRRVLVVPVGSLEQHGPHLPLDTDIRIAAAVAAQVVAARPTSGLAPAIALGASGEHAGFAGTLSIGTDALTRLVVELVRDATRDWAAVLLVNGHGGNHRALTDAVAMSVREGRRVAAHHLGVPGGDAHAGRTETSLVLALDPDRVRLDRAVAGDTTPIAELLPRLTEAGVRPVSPNGVLGDPVGASAAEGHRLLEQLVDRALGAHDRLDAEVPRASGPGAPTPPSDEP